MSEPFAGAAPGIAFIYSDESLAVHVREAIDAQVHIVYQASTGELDAQRLTATRVAAALVNLDSSSNADQLAAVLDAAGVPVVFNDAEISRGLDGWARARWARHLLAKLRGSNDFYPPRPDAAAPGQPVQSAGDSASEPDHASPDLTAMPLDDADAADPGIASRPLSPREIESLVADFPVVEVGSDEGTAALSALVDARLAELEPVPEPAPWETAARIGETVIEPEASAPVEAKPASAATAMPPGTATEEALPDLPAADMWRLVEDHETVISAADAAAKPAPVFTGALADLELVPIEEVAPAKAGRTIETVEMRLEAAKVPPAPAPAQGGEAA